MNLFKNNPKKSDKKSLIQSATDTFREVALIFLTALILGGISYSLFEHKPLLEGVAWALTTGFTIGYNDVLPTTAGGDITARILMTLSAYVIIPLITALMAYKMLRHKFDEVKESNDRIFQYLEKNESNKKSKSRE